MSNIIQSTNDQKGKPTEVIIQYAKDNIEEISKNGIAIQNVFEGIDEEIASLEAEQVEVGDHIKEREGNYKEAEQVRNKQTALAGLIHQKNALAYQIKKSMSNLDKGKENISGTVAEKIEITLDFINGKNPERFARLFDKNNPYYYIAVAYIYSSCKPNSKNKEQVLKKLSPFINVLAGASGEKSEYIREAQYICSYFVTQNSPELDDISRQINIDELVTNAEKLYTIISTTKSIDIETIGGYSMIDVFDIPRETAEFAKSFISNEQTQTYLDRKINNIVLGVEYHDDNKSLGEGDKGSDTDEDDFNDLLDS